MITVPNMGMQLITESLALMEDTLHKLAATLDPPQRVELHGGRPASRYTKRGVEQAIIPKMARIVSTTRAAILLLEASYFNEFKALKRMVEEAVEDVMFLARGLELGLREVHQKFLDSFYAEYWKDGAHPEVPDVIDRPPFQRHEIRKYMDELSIGGPAFPGDVKVSRLMKMSYQVDSGYVHGNCSQLMELYGGNPPRYHVSGVPHPTEMLGAALSLKYSLAMALTTFATTARAFGDTALTARLYEQSKKLYRLATAMQNTFEAWERSPQSMPPTS
jgi:hypothetical protein